MKKYSNKIALYKNKRGVWDLDPVKGCKYGMANNKNGCYGSCYAYRLANIYECDFSHSVIRGFKNKYHLKDIISEIKAIDTDFIRMGVTGDPSECWEHTINICEKVKSAGKQIVIITKHWEGLPYRLYEKVKELNLIINTSISALDGVFINHRLNEYNKLKKICKSVLRVVSCDFNTNNPDGLVYNNIQDQLFDNENVIDNILRVDKNHPLVRSGTINIEKYNFLSNESFISRKNKNTYIGYCENCPDMCGVSLFKVDKSKLRY